AEDLVTANMPGRSRPISYEVIFQRKPGVQAGNQSTIQGRILGGPPNLIVALIGANLEPRWQRPDANGNFTFGELAAGTYQLSLAGVGLIGDEIVLDGAGAAT